MATLEDLVKQTVSYFVVNEILFTALDVSNKVKESMPLARHREVRDLVRNLFATDMSQVGYGRSPITVTLPDQTTAEALLYHPLSDSWDLDSKYDSQKRAQAAARPSAPVTVSPTVASVSSNGTVVVPVPAPVTVAAPIVPAPVVTPTPAAHVLWAQLFNSKPSLFPRR